MKKLNQLEQKISQKIKNEGFDFRDSAKLLFPNIVILNRL